jgi:hypothetical protein
VRRFLTILLIALGVWVALTPLSAHHAFDAEYDRSKLREFKGTVTRVEWLNPHARVYVDVIEPSGKVVNWEFELGSPNGLMRSGWTRYSLQKGDVVAIVGNLAKDGSNLANARNIVFANGKRVLTGSSADDGRRQ